MHYAMHYVMHYVMHYAMHYAMQEKEAEGDFQAAMVMQENHLDRTILDLTSLKKVKERVNSQLRLAQVSLGTKHPDRP